MIEWCESELGNILTLNYGWSLPEKKRASGDIPVYGSNGIVGMHNQPLVDSPGLIIGRKGSAGNVHYSRKPFCPIDTTFYVSSLDTNLDIEFLYYLLLYLDLKRITGDVGVPGLNREMAYKEKARYPLLKNEQRKIATVLGLAQRAIEEQERLLALTTELKKTLLHKLFTEGPCSEPQKQTEIGPVPESWTVVTVGDLFKFTSGKSRPKDTETTAPESRPYPVFGGNGILGYSGSYLIEDPKLLLGRVGEYCGCAHHSDGRAWISDNALYAKNILGDVDTRYAVEYFNYANLNQYSSRAGQPLITQGIISKVKMPLPSLDHQREILEPLRFLNQRLLYCRTKIQLLTDLFCTLLHQLMTAQIRVHDLDLSELETGEKG
jgi:type I restriction enzyme S subunit